MLFFHKCFFRSPFLFLWNLFFLFSYCIPSIRPTVARPLSHPSTEGNRWTQAHRRAEASPASPRRLLVAVYYFVLRFVVLLFPEFWTKVFTWSLFTDKLYFRNIVLLVPSLNGCILGNSSFKDYWKVNVIY